MDTPKPNEIYKNYKGFYCEIIDIFYHATTAEPFVSYKYLDNTEKLICPLSDWLETINQDGYVGPRFTLINEIEAKEIKWLIKYGYKPVCPYGYMDCICDPAYIKYNYPDWYKKLYGDLSPEEAIKNDKTCGKSKFAADCPYYDDEDK